MSNVGNTPPYHTKGNAAEDSRFGAKKRLSGCISNRYVPVVTKKGDGELYVVCERAG